MLRNINKTIKRMKNKQTTKNQIPNSIMKGKEECTIQGTILLPHIQEVTDRISRIAKKFDIITVFNTNTKIGSIFRNQK